MLAEGAGSAADTAAYRAAEKREDDASTPEERTAATAARAALDAAHNEHTLQLAHQLEAMTGLESRVTILGYVARSQIRASGGRGGFSAHPVSPLA